MVRPSVGDVFEDVGSQGDGGETPWSLDDAHESLPLLPPMPEDVMDGLGAVERARLDEFDASQHEAELGWLTPVERFEQEYGYPADPDPAAIEAATKEAAAVWAQDLAVQANRMRTIAEAHRVATLLIAFERSLQDLGARFGSTFAYPNGLGSAAFHKSFGLLTKTHPNQVSAEVSAATTLRDRLPLTWAAFQRGDASWSRVKTAVSQADGLDAEHWAAFDSVAAGLVVSSYRLKGDLHKERERLQDDTAAKRARTTHEQRRTSLELGHDGGVAFVAEGLAASWVPVNDGLHRAAVAAHGTDPLRRSVAQLRHDIALDILHEGLKTYPASEGDVLVPDRKPVDVTLILTVPALAWLGKTKEQAQLGGYGPIDLETAKDLAGSAKSFIRVLTHPFTGARLAMDRTTYTPPADLARWVRIRDGRSRFPGSTRPAHLSDIDHAREWQHGGRTDDTNLITLDRPTHNLKSAGLLQEQLHDTGIVGWTDAWDRYFEDPPDDPLDPAPPDLIPPARPPDDEVCPF